MFQLDTWYRVTDPLNPLYGCDVYVVGTASGVLSGPMAVISKMRRVDIFVGDRPFQLVAPPDEVLGVMVRVGDLEVSPLQDEKVETGTDRPHGLCIDESEMTRGDGLTLRIARYELATQIAVQDPNDGLLVSRTETSELRNYWEDLVVKAFERGDDVEDIVYRVGN